MVKYLLVFFIVMMSYCATAQDAATLIKQADSLEHILQEQPAYDKFKQVLKIDPRNYYALWKCSELCSRIGFRQPDDKKKDYYNAGKIYAQSAIRVKPDGADGYYAMSLALGREAQFKGGKDRINAVKGIKTNAEKATQLNASHGRAWHVLGKWNYEVSQLNSIEKAAVKIVYGGLPKASLDEAIRCYEKAKQLEPEFALNNLELAKAYHAKKETAKAILLLKQIPAMPKKTQDDDTIRQEAKKLLQKWQ